MAIRATKVHILESAIEAIEIHGLHKLTTRLIAEQAGVNNAALHYYFGTKELLVEEAMTQSIRHMTEDLDELVSRALPLKENLYAILAYLVGGTVRYPNMVRAHFYGPLTGTGDGGPLLDEFHACVRKIIAHAVAGKPETVPERTAIAVHSALSTGLLSALTPSVLFSQTGLRLENPPDMEKFCDFLTDMVMRA